MFLAHEANEVGRYVGDGLYLVMREITRFRMVGKKKNRRPVSRTLEHYKGRWKSPSDFF